MSGTNGRQPPNESPGQGHLLRPEGGAYAFVKTRMRNPSLQTNDLKKRLDELGASPPDFLALILLGEEPFRPHPFLEYLEQLDTVYTSENPEGKDDIIIKREVWDELLNEARHQLRTADPPLELRVRVAIDLMGYLYPKRRAVEFYGADANPEEYEDIVATAREKLASGIVSIAKRIEQGQHLRPLKGDEAK